MSLKGVVGNGSLLLFIRLEFKRYTLSFDMLRQNKLPSGPVLSSQSFAPINCARPEAMYNPNPGPSPETIVYEEFDMNFVNNIFCFSSEIPIPVSFTKKVTQFSSSE